MTQALHIVVLAAGQGKRMLSKHPKVLQPLAGRPLLAHVLDTARQLEPVSLRVVYGHGGELVKSAFAGHDDIDWVLQEHQNGTGHAVKVALEGVPSQARVLVMLGDNPLITEATLRGFIEDSGSGIGVLTAIVPDPTGYGRIIRDPAQLVSRIVEEKDADESERAVTEVNSGMLVGTCSELSGYLAQVGSDNAQGEILLTDVVGLAVTEQQRVTATIAQYSEILGVNDRLQLAQMERLYQLREATRLCQQGAIVMDPARLDVRGRTRVGQDVQLDINVVLEGENELGDGVTIGPHCVLINCRLGPDTRVHSHCVLDGVITEGDCDIGPFARLRPGTELAAQSRVGNFVETKQARIGKGSKVSHLSYVGDAVVGANVNLGAGTITCNYDGANKHQTVIGDGVFVGSNSALVAPIEIKSGATIGAGSTITKVAPADTLTLTRAKQLSLKGWKRPVKGD